MMQLSGPERAMAAAVAQWRTDRARTLGRGHGEARVSYDDHLVGAVGELALARHLGVYWDGGADDFGRYGDVAGYEARGTVSYHGHLIIYPKDPDDRVVVLVYVDVRHGAAAVLGMIPAGVGKTSQTEPKVRAGSPQQWWVPQSALDPPPEPLLSEAIWRRSSRSAR